MTCMPAGDSPLTVATDFNPLLLIVAREMFAGRAVELYEFPIAPRGGSRITPC